MADKYALRLRHAVVCAIFGGLFVFVNHLPLWHTDLWGHAAYGKWILAHRSLPREDPFMPLAEGMRAVDYAWLSQVLVAQIVRWAGPEWLSNVFAAVVLLSYVFLTRALYLRTGRLSVSLLGTLLALAVGWSRLATLRPETFGTLCFALLLWLVVGETARPRESRTASEHAGKVPSGALAWILVPVLFALWANLHGSFLCGLVVLSCCTAGRLVEVVWANRSLSAALRDCTFRRWLLLTELATAATLLNPYGVDLHLYCLRFGANENLRDMMEWFPLVLQSPTGVTFGVSCVLLGVALRYSRRRFSPADVLLWAAFAVAAIGSIRMIGWYAAVVAVVLSVHFADIFEQVKEARSGLRVEREGGRASFRYSLVCLLVVWMSFAFSGWSREILGRRAPARETLYSSSTPLGVSGFLRSSPPEGQLFNPQWWGDWLVWDGPSGVQPFVTTNVHLVPRRVWKDYVRIANAQSGWQAALERYRVTTVIVDKQRQPVLLAAIRREPGWSVRYEDKLGAVFGRSSRKLHEEDAPEVEGADVQTGVGG